ncbi:hypothetical protein CWO91_34825 [Bradyrhizobium genosp. SA-3]|uniref:hypothetical protein n=1 Tax=Bradyrhizobium genosp. SA-3 TaxID=508868 RepID=UPI001028BFB8|nr:hypothetical protein [Bradyrhizobium genosp. SA-3]RZM99948.1 hypothetical protein CWO91_34825 [Bradyrhizobium genosp. SA-3]
MALDLFGPSVGSGGVTVRPSETRSFTATDTFFRDCSSPDVDDGTEFDAAWFNEVLANLRSLARGNGQTGGAVDVVTQDNADDSILLKAIQHLIQRGQPLYGEDTSSTANVITAAISPAPPEYKKGMTVAIKAANSNSGATKINLNALGLVPVVRPDGSTLLDGDIVAGSVNTYRYDGVNFQLLGASARPQLRRNTTIYVNGAIGNDANDGTANDATHALATIQGAINLAFKYGPSAFTISIIVATGTYSGAITPLYPGPSIVVDGQIATNVIIDGSFGPNVSGSQSIVIQGPNTATVKNVTVQNAGGVGAGGAFMSAYGATLTTLNTRSNACGGSVFEAYQGGTVLVGSHTFNGSSYAAFYSIAANLYLQQNAVFTIAAPITMGLAFAWSTSCGNISVPGSSPPSFVSPGNVTGAKYNCIGNGVVNISGNGVNFFPGTVAGSTSNGGQYY